MGAVFTHLRKPQLPHCTYTAQIGYWDGRIRASNLLEPPPPIYSIDVKKGAITRFGFPNFKVSGGYLRGGSPRCQTRWRRGEKILNGGGLFSFGESGNSPLYIYGPNRLLGRSMSGLQHDANSPYGPAIGLMLKTVRFRVLGFPNAQLSG